MPEGRAIYEIQVGNEIITFEGPDNLNNSEIERLADQQLRTARPGQKFSHSRYIGREGQTTKPTTPSIVDDTPLLAEDGQPAFGENESSSGGSYVRGALKGGFLDFDDELAAAGNAAIPGLAWLDNLITGSDQVGPGEGDFWQRYTQNMDEFQHQADADTALHPTANFFGKLTGAASSIGPAARVFKALPEAVQAATTAHPILSSIVLGGATGAAAGAGEGRGNRAQSAALGGLTGGALGGSISGAIVSAPVVAQYASVMFKRGSSVTREAIQQITKALQRDGYDVTSPAGVQRLKGALEEYGGKPVSLADIGSATRARTGVGLRAPSEQQQVGIDTTMSRQAGQPQRLARDIRETVAPRTDVHAIDDDLVAQRAEEAEKLRELALYEKAPDPAAALEDGVERTVAREVAPVEGGAVAAGGRQSRIVDDPELQQLARLPFAQRALKGAVDQATAERDLLAATGQSITHIPDLTPGSQLDMRAFDYLKRYLDDEVNALYRRGQGRSFTAAEAEQVKQLRNAIRERLKTYNPDYANYLDAYKGSSEMIDALRTGNKFDELDPEVIAAEQAGRSTAGQELYRVGVARNLLDRIKSARGETSVPANTILNSPEEREQLLATGVEPEAFNLLNLRLKQERTMSLLPKEIQGSQTAQRAAAQADAEGAAPNVPFNPASGYGWAGALIRGTANKLSTARNAAVNEELLPRLLSQDPKVIEATIAELEKAGQVALARQIRRSMVARRSSAVSGNIIGAPVSLPAEDY